MIHSFTYFSIPFITYIISYPFDIFFFKHPNADCLKMIPLKILRTKQPKYSSTQHMEGAQLPRGGEGSVCLGSGVWGGREKNQPRGTWHVCVGHGVRGRGHCKGGCVTLLHRKIQESWLACNRSEKGRELRRITLPLIVS